VETYVASRVMYVPPITGSAILAWRQRSLQTTVFVNVEKICSAMTRASTSIDAFGRGR